MEWIRCDDRLPEEGREVFLFFNDAYDTDIGVWNGTKYSNGGWWTWKHGTIMPRHFSFKELPTHWMPLPEPPKD